MADTTDSGRQGAGAGFERGLDLDRVVFFSDAVFAISMTVLALSLHIPARTRDSGVAHALRDALPSIYSYALSFAVIGLFWLAHHRMFRYIVRLDAVLLALNLATLGVVAFVPFPTEVLGDHGKAVAAVVFYAATMSLLGALISCLWAYASHGGRLIRRETPSLQVAHGLWRSLAVPAVFLASIPIAFVNPQVAIWSWLTIVAVRVLLRRHYGSVYRT